MRWRWSTRQCNASILLGLHSTKSLTRLMLSNMVFSESGPYVVKVLCSQSLMFLESFSFGGAKEVWAREERTRGLGHGAWAAGAMKFSETALPLYKIDWNLCKWSDRENNSFGLSLQDMRSWVAFAWWILWVLVAILMSLINLIYEFGESYSSYMSVYCAYESYEFCVSLMSLMSLGCVCVCVSVYIGISICLSKFCVYKRSAHSVRLCCVGRKLRAVFFLLDRQDLSRLNSLYKSCDVLHNFSWALEVVACTSLNVFLSLRI